MDSRAIPAAIGDVARNNGGIPQQFPDSNMVRLRAAQSELRRALGNWIRTNNPDSREIAEVVASLTRDAIEIARTTHKGNKRV